VPVGGGQETETIMPPPAGLDRGTGGAERQELSRRIELHLPDGDRPR
jgi:hypothetical protein